MTGQSSLPQRRSTLQGQCYKHQRLQIENVLVPFFHPRAISLTVIEQLAQRATLLSSPPIARGLSINAHH
jgi:hypothetical protein